MLEHKGTQTLRTERLTLRRITPADNEMVYRWMGDAEVCKYERWTPHPNSLYSGGYIREVCDYTRNTTYQWGIEWNGMLVGSVSVVGVDDCDQKATIGYCLARAYWSRGIMTEAVKAVLRYMFIEVGINRIEASHAVQNVASGRVLAKAGMKKEGFAKEYYRCNAGFADSDLYGLTRSEYEAEVLTKNRR